MNTKDGTLGEVAVVDKTNLCINQSVASLEPKESEIMPEFLSLTLQRPIIRNYIKKYQRATTIAHISITDLAKWGLDLPIIKEQKEIVNIAEVFHSKISKIHSDMTSHIQQFQLLKNKILQYAFEGKLVPQDPNDESTSELLKRNKIKDKN